MSGKLDGGALTVSTQGMMEAHEAEKYKALLCRMDDHLCEILSGDQGAYKPHPRTVAWAKYALDELRAAYPLQDRT